MPSDRRGLLLLGFVRVMLVPGKHDVAVPSGPDARTLHIKLFKAGNDEPNRSRSAFQRNLYNIRALASSLDSLFCPRHASLPDSRAQVATPLM
jgi:hypothetical protein